MEHRFVRDLQRLVDLLGPHCDDRSVLDLLVSTALIDDEGESARELFDQARAKTLKYPKEQHPARGAQHEFEEICAKTIYNLKRGPAPYDPDSPYWIVPNALTLSSALGLPSSKVVEIVA